MENEYSLNAFEVGLISVISFLILFVTMLALQNSTIVSPNSPLSESICNVQNTLDLPLSKKKDDGTSEELVLIVKPNSILHLCAMYTPKQIGSGIFHLSSEIWVNWNEPLAYRTDIVSVRAIPDQIDLSSNSKSMIIYEIKTKEKSSVIYHLVDSQICGSIPIIIGDVNQNKLSHGKQIACDDKMFNFTITGLSNGIMEYH